MKKRTIILTVVLILSLVGASMVFAEGQKEEVKTKGTLIFADMSWDSIRVHNRISAFIIKHAFHWESDYTPGGTIPSVQGLINGDIDIDMESWTENIQDIYDKGMNSGKIIDLGSNFPDSEQGFYVPTYMIKGDPDRGIEPTMPDFENIHDLKKYWELFKDPEDPDKGRILVGPPGWGVTEINETKLKTYGLDEYFNAFLPGSDAALSGSMVAAYKKGEPWVGYYWAPTWVLGKLDMTLVKEPEYSDERWENGYACHLPPTQVNVLVNHKLPDKAPKVVAFLKNYSTNVDQNNEFLAKMNDNNWDAQQTAMWFLKNRENIWTEWVSADVEATVKAALEQE